jgi:XTP/dITP diphosphohydrolase
MELWVATSNRHKLSEISVILKDLSVQLKSFSDLGAYAPPPETGKTFEENASIKAKSFRSVKNKEWVIAEDSGLEVNGMNGLPGIHSARYAGNNASDIENNSKLLKMMNLKGVPDRSARLFACIVAYSPSGERAVFNGEFKGQIAKAPRGTTGFGYDSVFIPEGQDKTLAELGPGYKIQNSHRTKALKQFMEWAKTHL